MTEKELQETRPLPEAGGIAFTELVTKRGARINITARAETPVSALDSLVEAVEYAISKYGMKAKVVPMPQNAPKSAPVPAGKTSPPAPAPSTVPPPAPAVPDEYGEENEMNELRAVRMVVEPRADGKIKLTFYAENHKYPDLYAVRTIEGAVKMLSEVGAWQTEHLSKPADYSIDYIVNWVYSDKLNSKGNPYKNIVSIRPVNG